MTIKLLCIVFACLISCQVDARIPRSQQARHEFVAQQARGRVVQVEKTGTSSNPQGRFMNQLCPLCRTPATFTQSTKSKHFKCPVCSEFFIDSFSEDYLAGLIEMPKTEFRKTLSTAACATLPGQVFVIRETLPEERGGDGNGVARNYLIATHLSR